MTGTPDLLTRDLGSSQLKLSDELIIAPQVHGQKTYFHIENPARGKFYRVGHAEYVFLSLLDGTRTVTQALTVTARTLGAKGLANARGIQVANWLLEHRLADYADGQSGWTPNAGAADEEASQSVLKRLNPFWVKVPLGCPDRLLSSLLPSVGWVFSPWATAMGLVVILIGLASVASQWDTFVASAAAVLSPHNWIWMIFAWAFLKMIHELAHAMACKYYGGEVRETGLMFMLLAPMAYVNVTSCWRFPSRWQRIHVAAAGMGAELFIAAIAAVAWGYVDSALVHHLLFNLIVMASFTTLLFNANPLMRFDGYYILADLVEIPNLGTEGGRFFKSSARRLFFGEQPAPLESLGLRQWIVRGYGIGAAAWKVLICISLTTAASVLFHGAGLILAGIGMISWFGIPLWKIGLDLQRRVHENRPSFVRAMMTGTLGCALLAIVLLGVPWPGAMKAPAIVEYSDQSIVRTAAPGFVQKVHVADGQLVQTGQLLVELENEELTAKKHQLEIEFQQEQVRLRVALNRREGGNAQIAQRNLESIEEQLRETRTQHDSLQVRAVVDGTVVGRNLQQVIGTYVHAGTELLTVADETSKELLISIGQDEIDSVTPEFGGPTRFRIRGRMARVGNLHRLNPRASNELPHPAMSSTVGGDLTVSQQEGNGEAKMRLTEPRFQGVVKLAPDVCRDLGCGEQGYAILGLRDQSIGVYVWIRLHRWMESILRPQV